MEEINDSSKGWKVKRCYHLHHPFSWKWLKIKQISVKLTVIQELMDKLFEEVLFKWKPMSVLPFCHFQFQYVGIWKVNEACLSHPLLSYQSNERERKSEFFFFSGNSRNGRRNEGEGAMDVGTAVLSPCWGSMSMCYSILLYFLFSTSHYNNLRILQNIYKVEFNLLHHISDISLHAASTIPQNFLSILVSLSFPFYIFLTQNPLFLWQRLNSFRGFICRSRTGHF